MIKAERHDKPQTRQAGNIPVIGGTKAVDSERIRASGATHVLVNIDETPKQLAEELAELSLEVIVTHPGSPLDNPGLFRLIGAIFNKGTEAENLCRDFEQKLAKLQQQALSLPKRRVLYLIWQKPWMSISQDTYIANTLALVNWQTISDGTDTRYPAIEPADIITKGIDLVLFSTEPFPFTFEHIREFHRQYPDYTDRTILIDAEMVSWYGSRAIPGLDYLAQFARKLAP